MKTEMKKAIVFDLYDTLVHVDSMDFSKGLRLMYERYMKPFCTLYDVMEYSKKSLNKYLERHREGREYAFLSEEVPDFFSALGVEASTPDESFEYEFMKAAGSFSVADEDRETLERLYSKGVYMYVLSNSIYSARSAGRLLEELGIGKYFRRVFSSADHGIAKPSRAFFDIAIAAVRQDIPGIDAGEIVFTGDRYDLDAAGGCGAGMRTAWINRKNEENKACLPVRVISGITETEKILFPGKTVCVGDSLTEGDWGVIPGLFAPNVHSENYPYYLSLLTGGETENRGKCGYKASGILEWYKEGGFSVKGAERIVILLGTNGGHDPDADTEDNRAYRELLCLFETEEPEAEICLCTPPNATKVPGKFFYGYAPHVEKSVRFVRALARETGHRLIDLAASPRITPETEAELQPNDGLHFCAEGYRVLAEEIYRQI